MPLALRSALDITAAFRLVFTIWSWRAPSFMFGGLRFGFAFHRACEIFRWRAVYFLNVTAVFAALALRFAAASSTAPSAPNGHFGVSVRLFVAGLGIFQLVAFRGFFCFGFCKFSGRFFCWCLSFRLFRSVSAFSGPTAAPCWLRRRIVLVRDAFKTAALRGHVRQQGTNLCGFGALHIKFDSADAVDDRFPDVRVLEYIAGPAVIADALKAGIIKFDLEYWGSLVLFGTHFFDRFSMSVVRSLAAAASSSFASFRF